MTAALCASDPQFVESGRGWGLCMLQAAQKERPSLLAAFAYGAAAYACARAHAKVTVNPPKPGLGLQLWVATAAMDAMPEMPWWSNGSLWRVRSPAPSTQHAHSDAPPPVATTQGQWPIFDVYERRRRSGHHDFVWTCELAPAELG
jgi:hypothetical protein